MSYIYVLDINGKPLMPTTRTRHVKNLLDKGEARIAEHVPFTIQLLTQKPGRVTQPFYIGIDPGRTNIGAAVTDLSGQLLMSAVCETRNKEIRKLMENRAAHRRASRRGERLARKRLAKKLGTTRKFLEGRMLPGYEKPVMLKDIINTEARFSNRKRLKGWLTPTVNHLVLTHINLIKKIGKILPITDVSIEVSKFAFMLMEHPETSGIDYQNGPLKGFQSVEEAVSYMQEGHCIFCKDPIDDCHHIVPKSKGGSNTLPNRAGLCKKHHDLVHKDQEWATQLLKKKSGLMKKYHALSALNQATPAIIMELQKLFGKEHIHLTDGFQTSKTREYLYPGQKTKDNQIHEIDALIIAWNGLGIDTAEVELPDMNPYHIKQFRRHNRAIIKAQTERIYKLDGVIIARNRKKRMNQKESSLQDWWNEQTALVGYKKARILQKRLVVTRSTRRYNNPDRLMPGTEYFYHGNRYVMFGQLTNGAYIYDSAAGSGRCPTNNCYMRKKNAGLVFLSA